MTTPKKSLGQHWLNDAQALEALIKAAKISSKDTVLEIGPGLGSLTVRLVNAAKKVVAVELDQELAAQLPKTIHALNLEVKTTDILEFDLTKLPTGYKVVANIPYYLTSNLLRVLSESPNPPAAMALLVQAEVAQRLCARPGQMSILAVSVQLYYECQPAEVVPAKLFTPPPKVDSRIVALQRRPKPLFPGLDTALFFRLVKAGFSEKRKKLRSSLAGGIGIAKEQADRILKAAGIDGSQRAQELSLEDWYKIYKKVESS